MKARWVQLLLLDADMKIEPTMPARSSTEVEARPPSPEYYATTYGIPIEEAKRFVDRFYARGRLSVKKAH
jgi:hypothetical protein